MLTFRTRELGYNNKMGDTVLGTTVKEEDPGVTISTDMIQGSVVLQLQRVLKLLG